ncbi:MAG: 5-(carboxyamino)imidazole ribonucleotide synthase, partial [Phycisphaerae bacterium]|nr:5-(carboxyamino)imidazole ribonucleotide synthase [Phycisphaerae bacterium]
PVAPPPESLAVCQDRVREKRLFEACGIDVAPWRAIDSPDDLDSAIDAVGLPAVLKTRRLGYDGKGQRVIRARDDARAALAQLGHAPCILERLVPFARELSIVAVRGADGEVLAWPIGENRHRDGILHTTVAPASIDRTTDSTLRAHAIDVMRRLDHRGVLAIEYFDFDGRLLANEMAPRVHNSGHWTIDGAATSQFENHLRAILGLPLGSTAAIGVSAMLNLVGRTPPLVTLASDPRARVHLYGKAPRPGRKIGHLNVVAADRDEATRRLRDLEALVEGDGEPTPGAAAAADARAR